MLRIRHIAALADDADRANAESGALALEELGGRIVHALASSNCDRRLISVAEDMVSRVRARQDIIQLGIANISAQLTFDTGKEELPDVLFAQLQAFSISLSMYVAQFPQWTRFSENAAMAEYTAGDVKSVYEAGRHFAQELENAKSAVDDEVPHTLRWMLEAIRSPRLAAKRTVFAAIRTIENLVSVVLTTFGEILGSAKDGAKKGVKVAVTGVVGTALLLAAAKAASSVSPAAAKVIQSSWLSKAADIVLKKLEVEK